MRLSSILFCMALVLASTLLRAQPSLPDNGRGQFCASEVLRQRMFAESPSARAQGHALDMAISDMLDRRNRQGIASGGSGDEAIYTIPIVFHIIHNNGPENLPDAAIFEAIRNLNDAFRNVGIYDSTTGVDTRIMFCLAQQDESGHYSTGIDRVQSPLTMDTLEMSDGAIKNLSRWNPDRYLNIWIVKEIYSLAVGPSVSGYAAPLGSQGSSRDGVVIESFLLSTPDRMKVVVHEIGHYLGLYHTFQGGCDNDDCLRDGDYICDTPPDGSTAPVPCGVLQNSCTTDADDPSVNNPFRPVALGGLGDQNDMTINYMDYGLTYCQSAFTAGQRDRMIEVLKGPRAGLLTSRGCVNTCASTIAVSFKASSLAVTSGTAVTFTNTTTGASAFSWMVDGTISSSSRDFIYMFIPQGNHKVKLIANNGDPACTAVDSVTVIVTCPIRASFTASDTNVALNSSIVFTSHSDSGLTTNWFIDGVPIGDGPAIQQQFPTAGGYHVYLVVSNGTCQDTMDLLVRVGDCRNSKRGNVWLFGNGAGVDFSLGTPVTRPGGSITAREGVASICDGSGRLVCSSNGETVWNRNNVVMKGGTQIGGSSFSAQPCVIVPMPSSDSLYYVFTTSNWTDQRTDLCYSVVDMSLDSGRGAVISKGRLLDSNVSERIAAVFHDNCSDIWIVSHEMRNDRFVAYRLTPDGVNYTPVISSVGSISSGDNRYGGLKFSPDGSRLCSTLGGDIHGATVELFDFDKATGIVRNPIVIADLNRSADAYSSEFSPNGQLLYVSEIRAYRLAQYDLSSPANIKLSRIDVCYTDNIMSCLQIGPDGRIYVAEPGTRTLGMIPMPNVRGTACGFFDSEILLSTGTVLQGLPAPIAGYTVRTLTIAGPVNACRNAPARYYTQGGWCASGINRWSVSGPAVIRSSGADVILGFTDSGSVELRVESIADCGSLRDTLRITSQPVPDVRLGNDTAICGSSTLTLDAGPGFSGYRWQDGSASRTFAPTASGTYWVAATTAGGCVSTDSIHVVLGGPGTRIDLGHDTIMCGNGLIVLKAGEDFVSYRWQDGSDASTYTAYLPGVYWVTGISACGDAASDTIVITGSNPGGVEIHGDSVVDCASGPIKLTATGGPGKYIWSTGDTATTIQVDSIGVYWVFSSNGVCSSIDSITIAGRRLGPGEAADLGADRILGCNDSSLTLTAKGIGTGLLWSTGATTPAITVDQPGKYWVTLFNGRCRSSDTVLVIPGPSDPADLGPDRILGCNGGGVTLTAKGSSRKILWSTGATTPAITVNQPGKYWVTLFNGRCRSSDTVLVTLQSDAPADIGADRILGCNDSNLTLAVTGAGGKFLWSTGATTPAITVDQPGKYWVTLYNGRCQSSDTVLVMLQPDAPADIGADRLLHCNDSSIILTAKGAGTRFLWSTGATTPAIPVTDPGTYWVTLYNGRCQSSDTVQVSLAADGGYKLSLPNIGTTEGVVPGTEITMPLRMFNENGASPRAGVPFGCSVRFDRTMLLPIGIPAGTVIGADRQIRFNGITSGTDTLAVLRFRAMLGDAPVTTLTIDTLSIDDDCLRNPERISGSVTMAVCNVGNGPRLIGSGDAAALSVVAPASGAAAPMIDYSLPEDGGTRLFLVDALGRRVRTLLDEIATSGRYRVQLDLAGVPSGMYFLVLQTPTESISRKLPVYR
ncbi:MAG: C-terminal target protein [Chlorobi bacterium]|nr:C-terminal target protein [Chlorobiota bacterium]